jgi:hypothetical protein
MPLSPTPRQVSPRSRIFQRHGTALAFALGGALMLAPAASWVLPIPAAMAQDDASAQEATGTEVIAQGVTKLPKGNVAWLINKDAVPGGDGASVASFPLGFGLTDDGSVEIRDEDGGTLGVLDRGEGIFLPSGKGGSLVSRTAEDAGFFVILLVSGEAAAGESLPGTVVGEPFAAPENRDVELELRRGVLRDDDEAVVPVAASQTPSLLVVTSGTAQLTGPDGQPVALGEGQFALLAGDVSVRSADGAPVEFAVASIGDAVTAGKGGGEDKDGQAKTKTKTRTNNAGATAAGGSSGGRGGGGGGGGGGRAAGGSGGGAQQGGAATGTEATPETEQQKADREARRKAREERQNQTPTAGTPAPVETPQDTTPATPTPEPTDDAADDTVDQDDEDIVIVDQDDTEVDDTDTQDASDPGTGDDTQVVETPVTDVPPVDDGTTDTTDPAEETPAEETPVTEDPVVDQTTGDEPAADDTQTVDPNAVTQDPAAEQTETGTEETVVEQTAPEDVVVEQTAPEEVVVEQTAPEADQSTSTGEAAPADGAATP